MSQKVTAVVGGQYGSEGKGAVVAKLANKYDVHVRTGSPQAGHTIWYGGRPFKMRAVPCGWINSDAKLVIGAGAVVNPRVLIDEIEMIEKFTNQSLQGRLFVDYNATTLTTEHEMSEGHTSGEIHKRIGSTGEGVGAARAARVSRDEKLSPKLGTFSIFRGLNELSRFLYSDTAMLLNQAVQDGDSVMLEGTQGFGLSLTHGEYPYVTSHDTTAAQLCADAGLAPQLLTDTIMVVRTFPIRVTGNSGPLRGEMKWDEFCAYIGKQVPQEFTTVTQLPRRIGAWDEPLMTKACMINRPTEVAITFMDYLSPVDLGVTEEDFLSNKALAFIDYIERRFKTFVSVVGTGYDPTNGWTCVVRSK